MKKLLATAIFALIGAGAFAQTTQGTIVVSGAVGYTKNTRDFGNSPVTQTSFNITPSMGYFILDGLEVGASIGYKQDKSNEAVMGGYGPVNYENVTKAFGFMPYLKKYFMVSDKVAFTASAQAGISKGTSTNKPSSGFYNTTELDISGFQVAVVPGISFFATDKIGINASFGSFGYSQVKSEYEGSYEISFNTSTFGLNLDSSTLGIGFSYHFNR